MTISLIGRVTSSEQVMRGNQIYSNIKVKGQVEVEVYLRGNHTISKNDVIVISYEERQIYPKLDTVNFGTSTYRILDPSDHNIILRKCLAEN